MLTTNFRPSLLTSPPSVYPCGFDLRLLVEFLDAGRRNCSNRTSAGTGHRRCLEDLSDKHLGCSAMHSGRHSHETVLKSRTLKSCCDSWHDASMVPCQHFNLLHQSYITHGRLEVNTCQKREKYRLMWWKYMMHYVAFTPAN